jgi:hypothetical protein
VARSAICVLVLCLFACDYFDYFPQREFSRLLRAMQNGPVCVLCVCHCAFILPPAEQIQQRAALWQQHITKHELFTTGHLLLLLFIWLNCARRSLCDASLPHVFFLLLVAFSPARTMAEPKLLQMTARLNQI